MPTKDEIFDKIMVYIDMGIVLGFYTDEEIKELKDLERLYYIQGYKTSCDDPILENEGKETSAGYEEFETGKFSYDEFAANP